MCIMSELWYSGSPLKMSMMCMFQGLVCGVPSRSHLLKVAPSRSARPLFQVILRESLVEYFVQRKLV